MLDNAPFERTTVDLHSEHPLWLLRHGLLTVVPPLPRDLDCDVLVVGAGITGALVAHRLAEHGIDCVVVDARDLAQGSTSASTALLQYDIDVPLCQLRERVPPSHADRAYRAGVEAIDHLAELCEPFPEAAFGRRPSLYLTRADADTAFMRRELDARRAAGIDCRWADAPELLEHWNLSAAGAIVSTHAAQVDPYRLTHALLRDCINKGLPVYDRTRVLGIEEGPDGVTVSTDRAIVRARWVVMATGYESVEWLPEDVVRLHSTYAVVSEPMDPSVPWPDRALLWEHADPYIYARWTDDHRLLFGGGDEPFQRADLRDALIPAKTRALIDDMATLWPGVVIEPAFAWAGTFGSTSDGLGYIGAPPGRKRTLFALGFGGNGITYSEIASRVITDTVRGLAHPDAPVFAFDR